MTTTNVEQTIKTIHTMEQTVAYIPFNIKPEQMKSIMKPAIEEIYEALKQQAIQPTGPLCNFYTKCGSEIFEFWVCVPISNKSIKPTGRVQIGIIPAARAAMGKCIGSYESLHDVWDKFNKNLKLMKLNHTELAIEQYIKGPEAGCPSEEYETVLLRPLQIPGGRPGFDAVTLYLCVDNSNKAIEWYSNVFEAKEW
jgi:effector-binding domain-containing protein